MKIFHEEIFSQKICANPQHYAVRLVFLIINYFKSHTVSFVASQNRNDRLKAVAGKSSVLSVVQPKLLPMLRCVVYSL